MQLLPCVGLVAGTLSHFRVVWCSSSCCVWIGVCVCVCDHYILAGIASEWCDSENLGCIMSQMSNNIECAVINGRRLDGACWPGVGRGRLVTALSVGSCSEMNTKLGRSSVVLAAVSWIFQSVQTYTSRIYTWRHKHYLHNGNRYWLWQEYLLTSWWGSYQWRNYEFGAPAKAVKHGHRASLPAIKLHESQNLIEPKLTNFAHK